MISVSHPEIGICCLKLTKNNYYKIYNINEKNIEWEQLWGCPVSLHTALCQAVASLLSFRRQFFSGLFPSRTAVPSSSCGLRPPLWSNMNNEIEDIKSLTSAAAEGPCIRALTCPDLFCVERVHLL